MFSNASIKKKGKSGVETPHSKRPSSELWICAHMYIMLEDGSLTTEAHHGPTSRFAADCNHPWRATPAIFQRLCPAFVSGAGAGIRLAARLALARLPPARRRDLVDEPLEIRQIDSALGSAVPPEDRRRAGRAAGARRPGRDRQRGTCRTMVGAWPQPGPRRPRPLVLPAF